MRQTAAGTAAVALSDDKAAILASIALHTIRIAQTARRLVELRDRWLNPPEWLEWVDEPAPGYPKRPVARDEAAAKELKSRTLTNLYNTRPQWLTDTHAQLDNAVAAAYGWPSDITDSAALRELFALNQQ
ncbi:MAG: hypothetical protein OXI13_03570 [Gammaproteobacteria bacterium]|nr:hypothetical protein [Gammaproteobacteria bacterium]